MTERSVPWFKHRLHWVHCLSRCSELSRMFYASRIDLMSVCPAPSLLPSFLVPLLWGVWAGRQVESCHNWDFTWKAFLTLTSKFLFMHLILSSHEHAHLPDVFWLLLSISFSFSIPLALVSSWLPGCRNCQVAWLTASFHFWAVTLGLWNLGYSLFNYVLPPSLSVCLPLSLSISLSIYLSISDGNDLRNKWR